MTKKKPVSMTEELRALKEQFEALRKQNAMLLKAQGGQPAMERAWQPSDKVEHGLDAVGRSPLGAGARDGQTLAALGRNLSRSLTCQGCLRAFLSTLSRPIEHYLDDDPVVECPYCGAPRRHPIL